jgi:hypothetical protein
MSDIQGLDELLKAFAALPEDAINSVQPSIARGAQIVINRARVHLAKHNKTGALSRALKANKPKRPRQRKYQIFASVYFATNGRHGVPLELGHRFSGWLKGRHGRVEEKPFLRPAADESEAEIRDDLIVGINKALDNFGGKK